MHILHLYCWTSQVRVIAIYTNRNEGSIEIVQLQAVDQNFRTLAHSYMIEVSEWQNFPTWPPLPPRLFNALRTSLGRKHKICLFLPCKNI